MSIRNDASSINSTFSAQGNNWKHCSPNDDISHVLEQPYMQGGFSKLLVKSRLNSTMSKFSKYYFEYAKNCNGNPARETQKRLRMDRENKKDRIKTGAVSAARCPFLIGRHVHLLWGFVNLLRQDSRREKDVSEIRCDVRKQGLAPGWPLSDGIH